MTVDIWIRDYNPPRCLQQKISGRGMCFALAYHGIIPTTLLHIYQITMHFTGRHPGEIVTMFPRQLLEKCKEN
jgi:hypothetical protein